jgi:hypothetical protein
MAPRNEIPDQKMMSTPAAAKHACQSFTNLYWITTETLRRAAFP